MHKFWERLMRAPEGEGGAVVTEPQVTEPVVPVEPEPQVTEPSTPTPTPSVPVEVMQRRIAAMTKKQKDLERELELARLGQTLEPGVQPPAQTGLGEAEVRRQAALMAADIAYNQRVQTVTDAGHKVDPQFLIKINQMAAVHGEIPRNFVESVLDTAESDSQAAELLLDIANDPAKAAQLFAMSPTKQAAQLVRMQMEKAQKKAPAAPAGKTPPPPPIIPKVGAGQSPQSTQIDIYDSKTPVDDWMAERDRQARAARGRR